MGTERVIYDARESDDLGGLSSNVDGGWILREEMWASITLITEMKPKSGNKDMVLGRELWVDDNKLGSGR